MKEAYAYSYPLTVGFFWIIWLIMFAVLPRQRSAMFWTSLTLASAGPIGEFWAFRDYWHPAYMMDIVIGPWRFGFEDYFLTFAQSGIAAGLFENLAAKKGLAELPKITGQILLKMGGWGLLGIFLMASLTWGLGLHSIHAMILAIVTVSLLMLFGRWEILSLILPLAALYGLFYWLFYVLLFVPLFPGVFPAVWNLKATWGINLAGVPLEEILWAFSSMLFSGPVLRACAAGRPAR